MKYFWVLRFWGLVAAGLSLAVGAGAGEGVPDWEFEAVYCDVADFEATQLHQKEDAWLLTFRMRVKSLRLVAPVSELWFEGVDESDEVIWEKSHTIRRKDFEAAYGGGRSQFVRVFLREVPAEVALLKMGYCEKEEKETASDE